MDKYIKFYGAYGSNLNLNQMKVRCPYAVLVGKTYLEDYELEFRRTYLNIKPSKRKKVPLGIFKITSFDENRLDHYDGYPTFYIKEYIKVTLDDKEIEVMVYIMNKDYNFKISPPTLIYESVVKEGYANFGFEKDIYLIDEAIKKAKK